jgi:putative ABC transport system permease protein
VFTVAGVAVSTVILVIGIAMKDWLDFIVDHQFGRVDRSDIHVDFVVERPRATVHEVAALEGVRRAEGILQFGAELRNGWRKKTVLVLGLPADSRLYRIYDTSGKRVALPTNGLVVPESGLTVYATREFLTGFLGETGVVNGALVKAEPEVVHALAGTLDDMPGVQAVTTTGAILGGFEETVSEMMLISVLILSLFAGVIAFAVIYNSSAVSIAEQERDLACMCSLGFEREAVAQVATNDIMPLGLMGIIVGLPLGILSCHGLARLYETDIYKLPVVIEPDTYATVVALVLVFQFVARWVCRRRVYRIDIVRRLKTLE